MASALLKLARKHAGGKIAFLLEGGYDLAALRDSVSSVLEQMEQEGNLNPGPVKGAAEIQPIVRKVLEIQEQYS
jgi:acetoin utilization deacetylase AcuC-like enzyme